MLTIAEEINHFEAGWLEYCMLSDAARKAMADEEAAADAAAMAAADADEAGAR